MSRSTRRVATAGTDPITLTMRIAAQAAVAIAFAAIAFTSDHGAGTLIGICGFLVCVGLAIGDNTMRREQRQLRARLTTEWTRAEYAEAETRRLRTILYNPPEQEGLR